MSKHIKTFSTAVLSSKHIPPAWQVSAHFVPKARTVTEGLCSGQCKLISVFLNGMSRTPEINLDTLTFFFSLIMFVVSTITIISHTVYFGRWGLGETQTHLSVNRVCDDHWFVWTTNMIIKTEEKPTVILALPFQLRLIRSEPSKWYYCRKLKNKKLFLGTIYVCMWASFHNCN